MYDDVVCWVWVEVFLCESTASKLIKLKWGGGKGKRERRVGGLVEWMSTIDGLDGWMREFEKWLNFRGSRRLIKGDFEGWKGSN